MSKYRTYIDDKTGRIMNKAEIDEWHRRVNADSAKSTCSHGVPAGLDANGKARLPGTNCPDCKIQMGDYARRDRSRDMTHECYL